MSISEFYLCGDGREVEFQSRFVLAMAWNANRQCPGVVLACLIRCDFTTEITGFTEAKA